MAITGRPRISDCDKKIDFNIKLHPEKIKEIKELALKLNVRPRVLARQAIDDFIENHKDK